MVMEKGAKLPWRRVLPSIVVTGKPKDSESLHIRYHCFTISEYLKSKTGAETVRSTPCSFFQVNQQKLVQMLRYVQAKFPGLCQLHEAGKETLGQASPGRVKFAFSPT